MKSILVIIVIFSTWHVHACVKLYVKEHLDGSPICNLRQGDYIEICEDLNTVNGCPYNFYIYNKGFSSGSLTYELSLDRGWSTHYMTLMVNPTTKRFGFIIQGQTAIYSYYTESEIAVTREREAAQQRADNRAQAERDKIRDEKTRSEIKSALDKNEYFIALQLFSNLNFKDQETLDKIKVGWWPQKERLNQQYNYHIKEFNQLKKEYYSAPEDFISKHQININSETVFIKGYEAHQKSIKNSDNENTKVSYGQNLRNNGYVYKKQNNKHLICPIGIDGNYLGERYNEKYVDQLSISLIFDTNTRMYLPFIEFEKNEKLILRAPIVNNTEFQTRSFLMPLPPEINELYKKTINQSGIELLESLYPQKTLSLHSTEKIKFSELSTSNFPGAGMKNDKYQSLKNEFQSVSKDIELANSTELYSTNFFNPSLLYLLKNIYPKADSVVFVLGKQTADMGKHGLPISSKNGIYGWCVPLVKGEVALTNGDLLIYNKSGSYQEIKKSSVILESKTSLADFDIETLSLDSSFIRKVGYSWTWENQYPIVFELIKLNSPSFSSDKTPFNFIFNNNLTIMILPVYYSNEGNHLRYGSVQSKDVISNIVYFFKEDEFENRDQLLAFDRIFYRLRSLYFLEISNYFNHKKEGNSKKALKSLTYANKHLENFKQMYLNPKTTRYIKSG
jgi:hypothetical protein